jgi:hypothetical protein
MAAPYKPMVSSGAPAPPAGAGWIHEAKLDGFRCLAQVTSDRVRLWSRAGGEWVDQLPELQVGLSAVGEVVLDGEVVVLTADGRAGISRRAPVLAADSDNTGAGANLKWAADLLEMGRESAITVWPTKADGSKHDPSSYLAEHGPEALLAAVTSYQCLESTRDKLRPMHASELLARHLYNTLPASSPTERLAEIVALGEGLSLKGSARHEQTVVRGIGYRVAADLAAAEYPTIAAKISAVTEPRSLLFDTTADAAYQVAAAHVLGPEVVRANRRVISASQAWPSLPGMIERTARIGAVEFDSAKAQLVYARSAAKALAQEGLGPDGWLQRQMTEEMPLLSSGEGGRDEDTPATGSTWRSDRLVGGKGAQVRA